MTDQTPSLPWHAARARFDGETPSVRARLSARQAADIAVAAGPSMSPEAMWLDVDRGTFDAVKSRYDAGGPKQRARLIAAGGIAGKIARRIDAAYLKSDALRNPAIQALGGRLEDRVLYNTQLGMEPKAAARKAARDIVLSLPPSRPESDTHAPTSSIGSTDFNFERHRELSPIGHYSLDAGGNEVYTPGASVLRRGIEAGGQAIHRFAKALYAWDRFGKPVQDHPRTGEINPALLKATAAEEIQHTADRTIGNQAPGTEAATRQPTPNRRTEMPAQAIDEQLPQQSGYEREQNPVGIKDSHGQNHGESAAGSIGQHSGGIAGRALDNIPESLRQAVIDTAAKANSYGKFRRWANGFLTPRITGRLRQDGTLQSIYEEARKGKGRTATQAAKETESTHGQAATKPANSPAHPHPAIPGKPFKGIAIDTGYEVPGIVSASHDRKTVYIDKRIPAAITLGGKTFDPRPFLALREATERSLLDRGFPRKAANIAAAKAEKQAVAKAGINWKPYREFWYDQDGKFGNAEWEHAPPAGNRAVSGLSQTAADGMSVSRRAGHHAEASQLAALHSSGKVSFTPTAAQIDSAAFKIIVGDAKYTTIGKPVGTIYDGLNSGGLAEIKNGLSTLDSSYQLRLQTYSPLVNNVPYSIYTSRPINETFQQWLKNWGVLVKSLPK